MCYTSYYDAKLYERESHIAELTELHCWPNMGWAGHVIDKERREMHVIDKERREMHAGF
jgi:hypothetical protein